MMQKYIDLAIAGGLDYAVKIPIEKIRFDPGVQTFCKQNYCGNYYSNWACPQTDDVAKKWNEKIKNYNRAVLVETFVDVAGSCNEDTFRLMHNEHQRQFREYVKAVRKFNTDIQPFSAEQCSYCSECTRPNNPCRFPDLCFPAVEGAGLWVKELCDIGGIPYGDASSTLTYTSLLLVKC